MADPDDLPCPPRYLSRGQAAKYLGVSIDTFNAEVSAGMWPAGRPRGDKGGKLTWDRKLLDLEADRFAKLDAPRHHEAEGGPPDPAFDALSRRIDGQTEKHRRQRRHQEAA